MNNKEELVLLVLSCDAYNDLWDDFFNLKDRFWPECNYKWYLVTESMDYSRQGVEVIKCGKELNWAGRFRKAVNLVDTSFIGVFLEDYFITQRIDDSLISSLVEFMLKNNVSYLNMSNVFKSIINLKEKDYYADHLIRIPNHKRYGITTESSIWNKDFLLKKIGNNDYSAWQFEVDRCKEAESVEGLGGLLLCDDRMPFHVSVVPVVVQGMYYPKAIKEFRKIGYIINVGDRKVMSFPQAMVFKMKIYFSNIKIGKTIIKKIASFLFGLKYFTK